MSCYIIGPQCPSCSGCDRTSTWGNIPYRQNGFQYCIITDNTCELYYDRATGQMGRNNLEDQKLHPEKYPQLNKTTAKPTTTKIVIKTSAAASKPTHIVNTPSTNTNNNNSKPNTNTNNTNNNINNNNMNINNSNTTTKPNINSNENQEVGSAESSTVNTNSQNNVNGVTGDEVGSQYQASTVINSEPTNYSSSEQNSLPDGGSNTNNNNKDKVGDGSGNKMPMIAVGAFSLVIIVVALIGFVFKKKRSNKTKSREYIDPIYRESVCIATPIIENSSKNNSRVYSDASFDSYNENAGNSICGISAHTFGLDKTISTNGKPIIEEVPMPPLPVVKMNNSMSSNNNEGIMETQRNDVNYNSFNSEMNSKRSSPVGNFSVSVNINPVVVVSNDPKTQTVNEPDYEQMSHHDSMSSTSLLIIDSKSNSSQQKSIESYKSPNNNMEISISLVNDSNSNKNAQQQQQQLKESPKFNTSQPSNTSFIVTGPNQDLSISSSERIEGHSSSDSSCVISPIMDSKPDNTLGMISPIIPAKSINSSYSMIDNSKFSIEQSIKSESSSKKSKKTLSMVISEYKVNETYRAKFKYLPSMQDELRISEKDEVFVREIFNDGWAYGENKTTNTEGIFPINRLGTEIVE